MTYTNGAIVVRQAQGDAEIDEFYQVWAMAFSPEPDVAAKARQVRSNDERDPDHDPRQRRVALRNNTVGGGYFIFDRWLRAGSAYLSTGCIGGVATHPDHRRLGVGSALMRDAIAEAEERHHSLLLLHGIANYYHRFDYADILDHADQIIDRTAVPAEAPAGITVRPSTAADAALLLALRERHYGDYTGYFTRTLEELEARLRRSLERDNPPMLAFDADGNARGYLYLRRGSSLARAVEVATDSWPAAAALLRYHAEILAGEGDMSGEITWPLPADSPTVFQLADNLSVPVPSFGYSPRGWSVRGQIYQHPRAGWMSRTISVRRTLESLRPVWHAQLARASRDWAGTFVLTVGEESVAVALELGDGVFEVLDTVPCGATVVTITPVSFSQLVWGYRPVTYVGGLPRSAIPRELLRILETLFPTGHAWVLGSDGF